MNIRNGLSYHEGDRQSFSSQRPESMVVEVNGGAAQVSEEISDRNDTNQFTGLQV